MSNKTKLYQCPVYLFCNYGFLDKTSPQIAKECGVVRSTILIWLRKFNIRIKPRSEQIGEKAPMYGVHKKDIGYQAIHDRAYKVHPKPSDGKCQICNQVADEEGKIKLVHSNKNHTYRLPINIDEWQWIHESCHLEKDWTPERRKEHSVKMKKQWTPEKKKEYSENNPMKRPEVVKKMLKTKRKRSL